MSDKEGQPIQQLVLANMANSPRPQFFMNSFAIATSATELQISMLYGPQPLAHVVMALPVAKSLAAALSEAVDQYERATQTVVERMDELVRRIDEAGQVSQQ